MSESLVREPRDVARDVSAPDPPRLDPQRPDPLGDAARRLDRALTRLERLVGGDGPGSDLFDHDRAALAAELDAARARERELEAAAAAASQALGRAADQMRLALGEELDEPAQTGEAEGEPSVSGPAADLGAGDPPPEEPAS